MTPEAEDALGALQLLQAMYPLPGELELGPAATSALAAADAGDEPGVDEPLDVVVHVPIDDEGDTPRQVSLAVTFLLDAPPRIALRQSSFLTRGAYEELTAGLPKTAGSASDLVMDAIEHVRATAPGLATLDEEASLQDEVEDEDDGPLARVWFWFPSLSTREKRKDLVTYAARYRLTGFVLAGKPALLCLEGGGKAVDRYMGAIKSESWGDIPSFQKKVTERYRRPLAQSERKFKQMTDVTNLIAYHGTYNHRGDMGEVKRLMDEWGVGDDFGVAVMKEGSA